MRVTDYLTADHARLHALLAQAAGPPFDMGAFEQFRAGLLRHIGIEEKLVFAEIRRRLGGQFEAANRLRIEHAALTSLLVPTPDAALVAEIQGLLDVHDAREEGPDQVYARCEAVLGDASAALAEAAQRYPAVPTVRHFDGPAAHRTARAALESAERGFARRQERRQEEPKQRG
jgi:hypothetical protein